MSIEKRRHQQNLFKMMKQDLAETTEAAVVEKVAAAAATASASAAQENCPKCAAIFILSEEGFPTCTACGYIHKDILDCSPEWRFYGGADDKNATDTSRCGNPINPLLQESSMGFVISCSAGASAQMRKAARYTNWMSMPHREKSLYTEFQQIMINAQNAGLPKIIIDDAFRFHKDISEQKMFRGLNRNGIRAASIYIACSLNGFPRTSTEIAKMFNLDDTSASAGCSMAISLLNNVERSVDLNMHTKLSIPVPSDFIERFCSRLEIPMETTCLAKFIAKKIETTGLLPDNNTPQSVAAGIIFYLIRLSGLSVDKNNIREVCGVSEVTINKCSKKIENIEESVVPQIILTKYRGNSAALTLSQEKKK